MPDSLAIRLIDAWDFINALNTFKSPGTRMPAETLTDLYAQRYTPKMSQNDQKEPKGCQNSHCVDLGLISNGFWMTFGCIFNEI